LSSREPCNRALGNVACVPRIRSTMKSSGDPITTATPASAHCLNRGITIVNNRSRIANRVRARHQFAAEIVRGWYHRVHVALAARRRRGMRVLSTANVRAHRFRRTDRRDGIGSSLLVHHRAATHALSPDDASRDVSTDLVSSDRHGRRSVCRARTDELGCVRRRGERDHRRRWDRRVGHRPASPDPTRGIFDRAPRIDRRRESLRRSVRACVGSSRLRPRHDAHEFRRRSGWKLWWCRWERWQLVRRDRGSGGRAKQPARGVSGRDR
jgi:hypothetical protein